MRLEPWTHYWVGPAERKSSEVGTSAGDETMEVEDVTCPHRESVELRRRPAVQGGTWSATGWTGTCRSPVSRAFAEGHTRPAPRPGTGSPLGWKVSVDTKEQVVLDALRMALAIHHRTSSQFTRDGIIHHSDDGSSHIAIAFGEEREKENVLESIGAVGGAPMKSTIVLCKTETCRRTVCLPVITTAGYFPSRSR